MKGRRAMAPMDSKEAERRREEALSFHQELQERKDARRELGGKERLRGASVKRNGARKFSTRPLKAH